MTGWKDLGILNPNGISTLRDMRTGNELNFYMDRKYWNSDERDGFFKSTTTFWRGLRNKDVDKGVWIDNSYKYTVEEEDNVSYS